MNYIVKTDVPQLSLTKGMEFILIDDQYKHFSATSDSSEEYTKDVEVEISFNKEFVERRDDIFEPEFVVEKEIKSMRSRADIEARKENLLYTIQMLEAEIAHADEEYAYALSDVLDSFRSKYLLLLWVLNEYNYGE